MLVHTMRKGIRILPVACMRSTALTVGIALTAGKMINEDTNPKDADGRQATEDEDRSQRCLDCHFPTRGGVYVICTCSIARTYLARPNKKNVFGAARSVSAGIAYS